MTPRNSITTAILTRAGLVLVLLAAAAGAGLWLGEATAPSRGLPVHGPLEQQASPAARDEHEPAEPDYPVAEAPLRLFIGLDSSSDLELARRQMEMATDAGINRFTLSAPFPWPERPGALDIMWERLEIAAEVNPDAGVLLYLELDPPRDWLDAHEGAKAMYGEESRDYVSIASDEWRDALETAWETLGTALEAHPMGAHVDGFILACYDDGQWRTGDAFDEGEENAAAFRAWLERLYESDEALQEAWADEDVTLENASPPSRPEDNGAVFFEPPEDQPIIDYLRFASEFRAERIAEFAALAKTHGGAERDVLVPYGYSLELTNNKTGHFALARLLNSPVDGFVSPVSQVDRGIGGTGGFMGPVDSAIRHGKQWHLIDDTRTGIIHDPDTGEATRMEGIRAGDIYNVQTRNFASALSHGLGLMWADPAGEGALYDPQMWERFERMRESYGRLLGAREADRRSASGAPGPGRTQLAVVVDERSRAYYRDNDGLNESLLHGAREAAIRSGVPVQFVLLSDILEGQGPDASVYLFPNTFYLPEADRETLHAYLEDRRAAAIWLYAPGYLAPEPHVDHIAATTRLEVFSSDEPVLGEHTFKLPGRLFEEDHPIGSGRELTPAFYMQVEEGNELATYDATGETSIGIVFLEDGWTSIYVAEPWISPRLLRELLYLLGEHVYFPPSPPHFFDAAFFGPETMTLHANASGERRINLGWTFMVRDLLNPAAGWPRRNRLDLPMNAGDTRILELIPANDQ